MDYMDCHADTLTVIPEHESLYRNTCDLDLERVRSFAGAYTQIFALWKDRAEIESSIISAQEGDGREDAVEAVFQKMYRRAAALLTGHPEALAWCRDAADMEKAHEKGLAAAFLSVEDISLMGSLVEQIRDMGIRFAMLTWNYENAYACGAVTDQEHGLSEKGRTLVDSLLRQEVILDISHLSDQGAEDIFLLTDKPVMASHSNVREVCDHPRNLGSAHIRELIRRRGLLGLNFYKPFVGDRPGACGLLRHIDAVLELGGEDILAIGSDLDGCGGQFADGIEDVRQVPYLRQMLEQEGLDRAILDKIFFKNAHRFLLSNL